MGQAFESEAAEQEVLEEVKSGEVERTKSLENLLQEGKKPVLRL